MSSLGFGPCGYINLSSNKRSSHTDTAYSSPGSLWASLGSNLVHLTLVLEQQESLTGYMGTVKLSRPGAQQGVERREGEPLCLLDISQREQWVRWARPETYCSSEEGERDPRANGKDTQEELSQPSYTSH